MRQTQIVWVGTGENEVALPYPVPSTLNTTEVREQGWASNLALT